MQVADSFAPVLLRCFIPVMCSVTHVAWCMICRGVDQWASLDDEAAVNQSLIGESLLIYPGAATGTARMQKGSDKVLGQSITGTG